MGKVRAHPRQVVAFRKISVLAQKAHLSNAERSDRGNFKGLDENADGAGGATGRGGDA